MLNAIVVDDHPASRTFLLHFLKAAGHEALKAETAHEALELAERTDIDLWLIDWMMPGMTGIELVKLLRAAPGGEHPYLIMLTSRGGDRDLAQAFDAGVDDFISKPISAIELQARLKGAARMVRLNTSLRSRLEEIAHLNGRLEVAASTDMLTGLLNRRAGFMRLNECWMLSERYERPMSVAVVDIDKFKEVNDHHGHAFGDVAITLVAAALRTACRDCDHVVRIGGDEFLLVFPEVGVEGAVVAMERARAAIAQQPCTHEGAEAMLSISVGVAERRPEVRGTIELMKLADDALYMAKREGRDRIAQDRSLRRAA